MNEVLMSEVTVTEEVLGTPRTRLLTPDDFRLGGILGEGAFAKVLLGTRKSDGKEFAVKVVDKAFIQKHKKIDTVINEKKVLSMLQHPGVVSLHYTFQDKYSLYYVLELAKNGEMFDQIQRIKRYELEAARFYAAELVLVCEYLHGRGVIHRDLKPENILFSDTRHIKVTDFGTAKIISDDESIAIEDRKKSFVGTAEYVSPEVLNDEPAGVMVDMWALGCIIYQMLAGKPPFRGESEYLTFQKILHRQLVFPDFFPPLAKDLIDRLLVINPAERLGGSPEGYAKLKSHPFFAPIHWESLLTQKPPEIIEPEIKEISQGVGDIDFSDDEEEELASLPQSVSVHCAGEARKSDDMSSSFALWSHLVKPGEAILYTGLVSKRRRPFAKKRQLILTNLPRLIEADPSSKTATGEILWQKDLWAELKNEQTFNIHTSKSSFYFQALSSGARGWVEAINKGVAAHVRKASASSLAR